MKKLHTKKLLPCLVMSLLVPLFATYGNKDSNDDNKSLDLPIFETSAEEVQQTYDMVTREANQKLAELAAWDPSKVTFENTIKAFEEIVDSVNEAYQRTILLKDVHPNQELRDKAYEITEKYRNWFIDAWANREVYKVINAYADLNPTLVSDEKKLLDDTVLSYKRAGFNDQGVIGEIVLTLKREINELETQIGKKIIEANNEKNYFTKEDLEGLEQAHLDALDQEGDQYVVRSGARGTLRDVIMAYAIKEETRKKAKTISNSRAKENIMMLTTLVQKRLALAKELGYESWVDYRTEIKMAKTGQEAYDFVDIVSSKLKPKFNNELDALAKYIVPGVNDQNNQIDSWDVYFFGRLYEADKLNVDYESLRQYFPYESVLNGMFDVCEQVFGLNITFVENPDVWHPDVQLVKIDEDDDDVLGYLYLDMFPRLAEGKMSHFASYGVVSGKELDPEEYRKPVNTLVCNFPVNPDGTPQPLLLYDMRALFHEFGHALHCIVSTARFSSQTGFNVPQDFIEVPSQMLENWVLDKTVFKHLAIPHPDMTDEFISSTIETIKKANLATVGSYYERQFGFGLMDLVIHGYTDPSLIPDPDDPSNLISITNQIMADTYLPFPEKSHLITSFNHLLVWEYDAGYYSYAWSDSIVAELVILFDESPRGYMDAELGMRLRREILEPGAARDVNESVETFLGKPLDPERKAFLKRLGVE